MASSLAAALEPFFSRRGERVLAAASVVETDRGMLKKAKTRLLALVAPMKLHSASADDSDLANADVRHATICVLAFGADAAGGGSSTDRHQYSVRQEFALSALPPDAPQHTGSTEAVFVAADEGGERDGVTVRVSFESSVQREVFSATVRKAKRAGAKGFSFSEDGSRGGGGFGGGAAGAISASTNAYGRLNQRKKTDPRLVGILPLEEEVLLAKEAGAFGMDLADVRAFEATLSARIAETEAKAISEVLLSGDDWANASDNVVAMREVIEDLERRVKNYSHELLTRRDVIRDIELESTFRQRRKKHLEAAITELDSTMAHLRLPENDRDAILDLVDIEPESVALQQYFANPRNVKALVSCMSHIERLIGAPPPEALRYQNLDSVQERAVTFDDLRTDVATKTAHCVDVVAYRASRALIEDRKRKTNRNRLVLLPPVDVFTTLEPLAPLFGVLRRTNYRRHCAAVRNMCTHLREVYSFEIRRFFHELRRIVRQVGWRGSQVLGDAENTSSASRVRRMAAQGDLRVSPMLTPRRGNSPNHSATRSREGSEDGTEGRPKDAPPDLVLFRDDEAGVRLLEFGQFFMPTTTEVRKSDVLQGYTAPGGFMRPDLAFAAALKATSDLVLVQRTFLTNCLGLRPLPRRWMVALRKAKEHTDTLPPGSPTKASHFTGLSDEETTAALAEIPIEERDELDTDDMPAELNDVTLADEVNTALWDCFAAENDFKPTGDNLVHNELVALAKLLAEKCDGLHLLPALAMLDRLLLAIDDGDSKSSSPLEAMRRRRGGDVTLSGGTVTSLALDLTSVTGGGGGAAGGSLADAQEAEALRAFLDSRDGFYTRTLTTCSRMLSQAYHVYAAEQMQSINLSAESNQGKPGMMSAFSALPVLLCRLDTMIASYHDLSRSRIEAFLRDLVHHLFDRLDDVTIRAKVADKNARKYSVFKQFLHHAFFAVTMQTSVEPITRSMLADFLATSVSRRDHYESLYITADLFPAAFPKFAAFMAVADEARRMFIAPEDLRCHGALKPEKVDAALKGICEQLMSGVRDATARLKKHFARAVPHADPAEDAFFRAALPKTFEHLQAYVQVRVESLQSLLDDLEITSEYELPSPGEIDGWFDEMA